MDGTVRTNMARGARGRCACNHRGCSADGRLRISPLSRREVARDSSVTPPWLSASTRWFSLTGVWRSPMAYAARAGRGFPLRGARRQSDSARYYVAAGVCAGIAAASSLLTAAAIPVLLVWILIYSHAGRRFSKALAFLVGAARSLRARPVAFRALAPGHVVQSRPISSLLPQTVLAWYLRPRFRSSHVVARLRPGARPRNAGRRRLALRPAPQRLVPRDTGGIPALRLAHTRHFLPGSGRSSHVPAVLSADRTVPRRASRGRTVRHNRARLHAALRRGRPYSVTRILTRTRPPAVR